MNDDFTQTLARLVLDSGRTQSDFVRLRLDIASSATFDDFRREHGIGDNIYTVSESALLGAFITGIARYGYLDLDDLENSADMTIEDPFDLIARAQDNWTRGFLADAYNCLMLAFFLREL